MQIYLVMYAIRDVVVNDQQNPNRDADGIVNSSYSNFTGMVFVSGFLEGRPTAVKMMILVSNNIQMDCGAHELNQCGLIACHPVSVRVDIMEESQKKKKNNK